MLEGELVRLRALEPEDADKIHGWGNDPAERFKMEPDFVPRPGAEGWAVSTPPVLAFAPLRASLEQFDRAGIEALRGRSERLTGYLEGLLDEVAATRRMAVTTPSEPDQLPSYWTNGYSMPN